MHPKQLVTLHLVSFLPLPCSVNWKSKDTPDASVRACTLYISIIMRCQTLVTSCFYGINPPTSHISCCLSNYPAHLPSPSLLLQLSLRGWLTLTHLCPLLMSVLCKHDSGSPHHSLLPEHSHLRRQRSILLPSHHLMRK